jgi:hypothetical protein
VIFWGAIQLHRRCAPVLLALQCKFHLQLLRESRPSKCSRGVLMIQYVCETCSAIKGPEEVWIVGTAAEAVGSISARRELNIQSVWNRTTALHPLAVHFCSTQCKDDYMARLFAPEAPVEAVMAERLVPTEITIERVVPARKRVVTRMRKTHRVKRAA